MEKIVVVADKRATIKNVNLLLCLLLLLAFISALKGMQANAVTTISVSPSSVTVMVGQSFSIDVTISAVSNLYGWEYKLRWNASLLSAVSVVEGSFLETAGNTFFVPKINNTAGSMIVDCTLLGDVWGVSGSGILSTVSFNVITAGETLLDLQDTMLIDYFEQQIPHDSVDGYGYFTPQHDVAVTKVEASPTVLLPDQSVQINATAQNKGAFMETINTTVYYDSQPVGTKEVTIDSGSSVPVQFTWDTNGMEKGDYLISAEVSVVEGETNTADNFKTADYMVTILSLGHDVAITQCIPSKTIIGLDYPLFVDVTAKNYGSFAETFNVTFYVNSTFIATRELDLSSGSSETLTFTWNTTGCAKGTYILKAYAPPVPSETYTIDNTGIYNSVQLTIPGDIDGNNLVDMRDIGLAARAFGATPSDPRWTPNPDINSDNRIDMRDIAIAARNFGQSW